jgi:Histone deacetylase domain
VLGLSVQGYHDLVAGFRELAERLCAGRIVLVLEGGYNRQSFHGCAAAALRALRGVPAPDDPLGPCPDPPVASVDGSLAVLRGFMDMMASPDGPDYYDQPVQVPYRVH